VRSSRKRWVPRGDEVRAARDAFLRAAWRQRGCAVSGDARDFANGAKNWEAHHVVEARELKKRNLHHLLWDERNALRLRPDIHRRHTNRMEPVPMTALKDDNIAFAFEVMGASAKEYLERLYTGTDERVQRAFEVCEAERLLRRRHYEPPVNVYGD
jgi:hypothetical protein